MNSNYKPNSKAMKEYAKMLNEKLKSINQTPYYQREIGRELEISNSSVSRIIRGVLDDTKLSTFLALCKYAHFTDDEILYLYHIALNEEEKAQEITKSQEKIKRIKEILEQE